MSGFLLDTNIPSELIRSQPEQAVRDWLAAQNEADLHLSAISIGELRRGFELLPDGKRRATLEAWFNEELVPRFRARILPVSQQIADQWGTLDADAHKRGIAVQMADGLIAATAIVHGMTLVTRNVKDFATLPVTLHNPWPAD